MNIGGRIRKLRESMSMDDLGLVVELNRRGIRADRRDLRRWESGANTPNLDTCVALSDALDTTLDHLVKGEPEPATATN